MSNILEVEESVLGYEWKFKEYNDRDAKTLSQQFGFSDMLCKVLSARGVTPQNAESFLSPSIKNLLPDPFHYKDMEKAATRLAEAIRTQEKIAIFGDYDVDGATASSIIKRFVNDAGGKAIIYIPDRIEEGYGPNEKAIQLLWDEGARVLVTVDCGTVSYEPLAAEKIKDFVLNY